MISREKMNEELAKEIEEEEKKKKNKKILKILAFIFIPLFIIFTVSYILLRYIGNIGIVVKEYPITNNKITADFDGIKIVQFSDIHYNKYTEENKIKELVQIINKTNPDIVIFTGDLIDNNYEITMSEKEFLISEFNKIKSTIGKYAIKGEEDNNTFDEIFTNSTFEILNNIIKNIYKNNSHIQLIAVDDNYQAYSEIKKQEDDTFKIVITHMPDNTDEIIAYLTPDIVLAGHSHNGQVRLPFIGPLMKKIGSKKYIDAYYEIDNTKLFVSGGIGNTKYNMRLLNHPSINFFRLKEKA